MRNFPRSINTKEDITNLMKEYPAETQEYLTNILANKNQWLMTDKIVDEGVTDETHKVEVIYEQDDAGQDTTVIKERYQYELMEDPNGELYRLGYANAGEVEALLV